MALSDANGNTPTAVNPGQEPDTRPAAQPDLASLSYEQAMSLLEKVVSRLESGDISLDESMKLYRQGMDLAQLCAGQLSGIEHQITQLIVRSDGSIEEKTFGEEAAG